MNVSVMHKEFLTRYDAATSLAAVGWDIEEIDDFLNIGQLRLVEEKRLAFDLEAISNITITRFSNAAVHQTYGAKAYYTTLPENYLYYIRSRIDISRTNPTVSGERVPTDPLGNKTNVKSFLTTPFNKPWFKYPKTFIETHRDEGISIDSLIVLVDYYTVVPAEGKIEITFIIKPNTIDLNNNISSNVNLETHSRIVDYAVEEAVNAIRKAKVTNQ